MCEKWRLKVSWSTDMSPTATFSPGYRAVHDVAVGMVPGCGREGCTRGMGTGVGWGGAIPVPSQDHPQDPIFNIF